METKSIIWIGMFVGGTIGGFIPMLWGNSGLSISGIFFNAVGAIAGIYIAYRFAN
jgi:hypothetical protein